MKQRDAEALCNTGETVTTEMWGSPLLMFLIGGGMLKNNHIVPRKRFSTTEYYNNSKKKTTKSVITRLSCRPSRNNSGSRSGPHSLSAQNLTSNQGIFDFADLRVY